MNRRIAAVILLVVVIGIVLTACSSENKVVDAPGKYVGTVGYIQLNKDGTFQVDNKMILTGKYTIKGKDIEFNVEKMNGEEVGNLVYGTIKGDTIVGPDKLKYKKEK